MTNPFQGKTPVQEVLEQFEQGNFSKVQEFLNKQNSLGAEDVARTSGTIPGTSVPLSQLTETFQYLYENERGPVVDGLKSLEMMARVIKGVTLSGITLFEARIIAYSPQEMKRASVEQARLIVLSNLGMEPYLPFATIKSVDVVNNLNTTADTIAKRVKNGSFIHTDFLETAVIRCREVVKAALLYKKVL